MWDVEGGIKASSTTNDNKGVVAVVLDPCGRLVDTQRKKEIRGKKG